MKKQFDYIQDPGHGWVKVPLALIRELGIADKITRYSYWYAGHAYLEEDNDTCTFMNAYHARFGFDPKLRDRIARERRSRVRGYLPYDFQQIVNIERINAHADYLFVDTRQQA